MPEEISRAHRTFRRFSLGSGPLKRGSDRVELVSRLGCVLALVLALPVALTVGSVVHADVAQQAAEELATRHQQTAVLIDDAAGHRTAGSGSLRVAVPGRWHAPDGTAHEGLVRAPHDALAGDQVTIWVDGGGALTGRPRQTVDVVTEGLLAGLGTFLGVAALAALAHLAVRRALARHRARQWEREWRLVEPQWAGRR
jgi:hypothetical protein